ncbi:cellulase family glycosylhydrolase [Tamlana sp. I1]|uniref:cellulase family glycosylhydrolase n=1 Tax=Tamlana sp. I1 TaxID=2762061 RepID=UPI00188F3F6F|nr:cellulase family glycosylhydrolase [Tamlana sp. I1]
MRWYIVVFIIVLQFGCANKTTKSKVATRWSEEKAWQWHDDLPWLRGANFVPSTAINQLEMWQESTFDPKTIDKELGWAESIGFNCMRVYLHHAAWQQDQVGFKQRVSDYLKIAEQHHIKTIFVFFDDCWNPTFKVGTQPEPKPGVHNSGWLRDPGDLLHTNNDLMSVLETYVKDILSTFKDDNRIVLWDLYNEPGNSAYDNKSMPLLKNVFAWARAVNPSQPLTSGIWHGDLKDLNAFQLEHSDVISYHNYMDEISHQSGIDSLKQLKRPLICTEYMARKNKSRFQNIMPILKKQKIGAINWGLVDGKTNTKYAWDTPLSDGSEPELWFHEIFRKDGVPYKKEEVALIKQLTKAD